MYDRYKEYVVAGFDVHRRTNCKAGPCQKSHARGARSLQLRKKKPERCMEYQSPQSVNPAPETLNPKIQLFCEKWKLIPCLGQGSAHQRGTCGCPVSALSFPMRVQHLQPGTLSPKPRTINPSSPMLANFCKNLLEFWRILESAIVHKNPRSSRVFLN